MVNGWPPFNIQEMKTAKRPVLVAGEGVLRPGQIKIELLTYRLITHGSYWHWVLAEIRWDTGTQNSMSSGRSYLSGYSVFGAGHCQWQRDRTWCYFSFFPADV